MPLSAVDSIDPALKHTKEQLFRPFRLGQWTRLALVGLFAGEMSSGGGCNFNGNFPSHTSTTHNDFAFTLAPHNWAFLVPIVIVALLTIPIVWLLLMYVSSRMRFVLFDSVIAKKCEIGRMWRARQQPALQYFLWQTVIALVMIAGLCLVVGVPLLVAFLLGWFTSPHEHILALVLGGIALFFVLLAWVALALIVHVFTKDFVVPQMALENISAFEGWRRLWGIMQQEKGAYAGYGGMKLIMAIGAAVAIGILAFIAIVILLIPFGGLGVITVLAGKTAGLTWNVFTITAAIVAGSIFLLVVFYAVSLISVPVMVFFPAYSIYFFAARYPLLGNLIYPPPPPMPPQITPEPAPIG